MSFEIYLSQVILFYNIVVVQSLGWKDPHNTPPSILFAFYYQHGHIIGLHVFVAPVKKEHFAVTLLIFSSMFAALGQLSFMRVLLFSVLNLSLSSILKQSGINRIVEKGSNGWNSIAELICIL